MSDEIDRALELARSGYNIGGRALGAYNAAKKADRTDDPEVQRAVTGFVGAPHDALKTGHSGGFWSPEQFEDAFSEKPSKKGSALRLKMENHFRPVREKIKKASGDKITLYRHQRGEISKGAKRRNVLSWTSDPKVAHWFAGAPHDPSPEYDDNFIRDREAEYEKHGKTKIGRHHIVAEEGDYPVGTKSGEPVSYHARPDDIIWGTKKFPQIYRGPEHITDTDSVRDYIEKENRWIRERNEEIAKKRRSVISADVPLDDVVWATNRAGQKEFIVRNRPDAEHHINEHGEMPNVDRRSRASGGSVAGEHIGSDEENGIFHGPLHSDVAGRTDHLPLHTSNGAYILPADIVSAFGEGNTAAGFKVLKRVFNGIPYGREKAAYGQKGGPYGGQAAPYGQSGVYGQEVQPRAKGGSTKGAIPVVLAGGEYSIHPDIVRAIGDGDVHTGHEVLDRFVKHVRKDLIKTLKKLPGPKR